MEIGIEFGTEQRKQGWGSGLTILTAMANVLPYLDKQGRILALYHGLRRVASDSAGNGTRFLLDPLPKSSVTNERLTAWYRHCLEVRDTQGAERVLRTAIRNGSDIRSISAMMMTGVTDHFYVDGGHALDFHNKAFESLQHIRKELREQVLTSLIPMFGNASRSEESHSWQSPVDLVKPLQEAFDELLNTPTNKNSSQSFSEEDVFEQLLSDEPLQTIQMIKETLIEGTPPERVAQITALAAAERIVRFHTQNDFRDWITVLHTFTHAHAVHESLQRNDDPHLIRGIFHSAVKIYLDRFLNVPAAKRRDIPTDMKNDAPPNPEALLTLLDKQQQVTEAARWFNHYQHADGDPLALINTLGHALLREDADFHTFQMYEATVAEYSRWGRESGEFALKAKETLLLACTRYLAAHAPTSREQPHTARIAWRLHRGEKLFENE